MRTATRSTAAVVVALAGMAGLVSAQPATLTVDPAQSSIEVTATAITSVGNDTDTATSAVSGSIEIVLDDYGAPAAITLNDFTFALESDPTLNFSFGFFGTANATLTDAVAVYATPGLPLGPTPLVSGEFDFPAVSTIITGTTNYSYNILFVGNDSGSQNLADLGANDAPFNGSVSVSGGVVTLVATLDIMGTQNIIPDLVDVELLGTATIVATGPVPAGGCNDADFAAPFGQLTFADISAFLGAFSSSDPAADLAAPAGQFTFADISAFLTAFAAGCP